jgi:uncharacterized protein YndB with AHSA1/START domain
MGGLEVVVDVTVPSPVEDVWRYVVEGYFEHHASWDPAIVGMEKLTDGPVAVGTRGREVRRFGGRQVAEFEVTDVSPLERFAFRNTSGPFAVDRSYEIADRGGSTAVRFTFRMRPKGAMRVLFPLVKATIGRQVRANIERLAALVPAA